MQEEKGKKRLHDQYAKIKRIGQGHFGRALLVQSRHDRKYYVMKVLDLCRMDRKERQNVVKQVKLLKMLKSPFIIGYKQSFVSESKNEICIIMQYAQKGDLQQIIQKHIKKGPIPQHQILKWFGQICLGLSYLHRNKIMHRDLKTANIFVTQTGNCKIGDFGISKPLKQTDDMADTRVGTPLIMAPQIWAGQPYDRKSDIWSLGCLLYQLLTFKPPFSAAYPVVIASKVLEGKYQPLPQSIDKRIKNLVGQLLCKDPKKRPNIQKILDSQYIKDVLSEMVQGMRDKARSRKMSQVLIPPATPNLLNLRNASLHNISDRPKLLLTQQKPSQSTCNTLQERKSSNYQKSASNKKQQQKLLNSCQRLEQLRFQLQQKLGLDNFMRIYDRILKDEEYRYPLLLIDRQIRLIIQLQKHHFN